MSNTYIEPTTSGRNRYTHYVRPHTRTSRTGKRSWVKGHLVYRRIEPVRRKRNPDAPQNTLENAQV